MTSTNTGTTSNRRESILSLATTKSKTSARVVSFDDGHIPENTAGVSTHLVEYPDYLVRPPVVHVVDNAVPTDLVDAIYQLTVAEGKPWGTYVTIEQANVNVNTSNINKKDKESLAVAVAHHFFQTALHVSSTNICSSDTTTHSNTTATTSLWTNNDHTKIAHGVAIWALASTEGSQVPYHLDYAEQIRYESNLIVPPLLAGTLQCTRSKLTGGEFAVTKKGVDHYLKHGYKAAKESLDYGNNNNHQQWITIPYQYNRMILQCGHLPHLSTPITNIEDPNQKRVIVGFNVFGQDYGPLVQAAPEHSQVFRRKVQLQRALQRQLHQGASKSTTSSITLEALTANKGLSKLLVLAKRERIKQELAMAQQKLDSAVREALLESNGLTVDELMKQLAATERNQWPSESDVQVHINQRIVMNTSTNSSSSITVAEEEEENQENKSTNGVPVLRLGIKTSSKESYRMVQPSDVVYLL